MEDKEVKVEQLEPPLQPQKRELPAVNQSFIEEEDLQIFTKRPKVVPKRTKKVNATPLLQHKEEFPSNGLDATPKSESPALLVPGCSFAFTEYPIVDTSSNPHKRPKLNYRQLAFIALKNANFIPMQTPQICDFVETIFPFFSLVDDRSKILWRNALAGAVRTGKCDEGLFTTSSVYGCGARMFYGMRKDRIEQMEGQIKKWRDQFREDNYVESGVGSFEELQAVCSGTKGVEFIIPDLGAHVEQWKKSQLSGPTLEDYDAQERQRLKLTKTEDDELTEEERKLLARDKDSKKNHQVTCPICEQLMNSKSFGRHLKLIHRFADEDLLKHRIELQAQRMRKSTGHEELREHHCSCGKQFATNVMLMAHAKVCIGTPLPEKNRLTADEEENSLFDDEEEEEYGSDMNSDEKYDNIVLL